MTEERRKVNNISTMRAGFWGLPRSAMVGIIVACLGLAILILLKFGTTSQGPDLDVFEGELIWVKCGNPDCQQAYQMAKKKYFEQQQIQARQSPASVGPILVVCEKCGKRSLYEAAKCGNPDCGLVFIKGSAGAMEFDDRCPKCGYSQTENDREEAVRRRGK